MPSGTIEQTFVVNTLGPLRLIQAVAPLMRKQPLRPHREPVLRLGAARRDERRLAGLPDLEGALNVLTRVTAAELAGDGIKVNSACPGWVQTDMGGPNATSTVAEGADTAVWLATLPDDGPTGGFFRDRRPIPGEDRHEAGAGPRPLCASSEDAPKSGRSRCRTCGSS